MNRVSDSHALGLSLLVSGKTCANVNVAQILIKQNINITYEYLYYYLLSVKPIIQENAMYSTGNGSVTMSHFRELKIKVLKPHIIQQYSLDTDFEFMDHLKTNIQAIFRTQDLALKGLMQKVLMIGQTEMKQEFKQAIDDDDMDQIIESVNKTILINPGNGLIESKNLKKNKQMIKEMVCQ